MKTTKLVATLLAAAAFAFAPSAQAAPSVSLTDGTTSFLVMDQGPGDTSPIAGVVIFAGAIGEWILNVTTGLSKPFLPPPHLDLNSVNVSNITGGSGFLDIILTDVDFTLGAGPQLGGFTGLIGGTTAGTVTWSMFIDDSNTPFGMATLIGTDTSTAAAFSDIFSSPSLVDGTFSMTLAVRIVHGNGPGLVTSFDFEGQIVPEPGTILLLGAGLLAIALIRRRRDA